MCPGADLALKCLGMGRSTFPKNIIYRQSHTAALTPLSIPRCGPRIRHEKEYRYLRSNASGGSACQLKNPTFNMYIQNSAYAIYDTSMVIL